MVSILAENTYLDLFADTKVSVNFSNDTFGGDGSSFVTYSENVEIPLTDTNMKVFQINKATKTIGKRLVIGSIINNGETIMNVTCEVQSVEIACLEEKISLLVMDAVSGIMKDLKNKKLDILFDEEQNDAYYFKLASPHIVNPLYRYAFVDTNGYNSNINPSDDIKYAYITKLRDDAVPRMVFNVNECMSRIFGKYGVKNNLSFGDDLFTTLPYKDLSGVEIPVREGIYNPDFSVPVLQMKTVGASGLNPTQESMNKLVDILKDLSQYRASIPTDYSGIYDFAKIIGADSSFNDTFIAHYSGFFNDGEYVLKPTNVQSLVGQKFKYSLYGSFMTKKDFLYTDLSEAELFITVRKTPESIDKYIPVAKIKIGVDCVVTDVVENSGYLYSDKFSVKSGEKVVISYSIKFSGSGSFYQFNNETVRVNAGTVCGYKPMYLHLTVSNDSPTIQMLPVKPKSISQTNSVIRDMGFYEDCFRAFNKARYDEIVAFMDRGEDENTNDANKRHLVSLPDSFKESDLTAYDFVSEMCNRFNKKIFITNGAVGDTESIKDHIAIIDELNSSIVITPKDFENEIKSVQIKNKSYNSKYDKLYNGNGAFDSDEIIVNENNNTKKTVQLKSCPIPESVIGDGYAASDGLSELIVRYGMIANGVSQAKTVSSKEMDFRVCYLGKSISYISNTYPTLYGGNIYDNKGDKISVEIGSDSEYIMYTNPAKMLMNTIASNVLPEREMYIPIILYQGSDFNGEQVETSVRAKFRAGFLTINLPYRKTFSMKLKLTEVPELVSDVWGKLTLTTFKKAQVYDLIQVGDVEGRYRVVRDRDATATIVESGVDYDMKISVIGRSFANTDSRITIPLATRDFALQNLLEDTPITKTYPALFAFDDDEVYGECFIHNMLSYNEHESLSFNKLTANGKTTALEKYFADSISAVNSSESPYLELEIKTDINTAKRILSGSKVDIRGDIYQIIEASDIDLGESSIVKLKLSK